MIDIFASKLADCVESIEGGEFTIQDCLQKYPEDSEELEQLLNLVVVLENIPVKPPDEDFEREARARILSASSEQNPGGFFTWLKGGLAGFAALLSPRPAFRLGLLAVLLVVLLGSGVMYASAQAMPGDFLYPVKIFIEDARSIISGDDKEADLQIDLSKQRIKEVDRLIDDHKFENIPDVVERYVRHMDKISTAIDSQSSDQEVATDEKSEVISSELRKNIEVLEELLDKVPDEAKPAIENAIEASSKNQDKLNELFPDGKPGGGPKD